MAGLYDRIKRFNKNTTQSANPESSAPPARQPAAPSSTPLPVSLKNIPGLSIARDLVGIAEKREREKNAFLETIGVVETQNERGVYGFREIFYPQDELLYGSEDITGAELALQARDESLIGVQATDILFLDTETTGLAGGTGTVPFLVGVGFFDESGFRVRQFLMRDYDEEPAVLLEIHHLAEQFRAVASYNGKGFDVPLLQSRFLLNRFRSRLADLPHVDFLFTARRFWREVLPSCALSHVEGYITGQTREDDVPGELIPGIYFDFLRGLRIHRMRPVLNHNALDVLALAYLASRTCRMLRAPHSEPLQGSEWVGIGRCHAAAGNMDRACEFFERASCQQDTPEALCLRVQKQLSLFYKRMMRYTDACRIWEKMISDRDDLYAHLELAKYYEHTEKDIHRALSLTEKALAILQQNPSSSQSDAIPELREERLMHRKKRLQRKLNPK